MSPVGIGRTAFWQGLLAPQPKGERRAEDFDPAVFYSDPKSIRRADRFEQFAVACAAEALEHSGALRADPSRIAVIIGTGIGGVATHEAQTLVLRDRGPRRVSAFTVPMMMANSAAAAVSMAHGFRGPCEALASACASGTHSIAHAARLIAWGICDAALAGGSESAMTPVAVHGFANMKALSPQGRSRPFDAERDGFVISEGASVLVLEALDEAVARGAAPLAEILGAASTADAHHITAPAPGGRGAIDCMSAALKDAGCRPEDVVHVNAHGTGTSLNDAAEAQAIAALFGAPGPAVTATKGVTGHALGAAGAIEAAALVLSMQHRLIPPIDGLERYDPELPPIDVVTGSARKWTPGPSLSNSFGFGGHNGTLVLGPAY